MKQQSGAEKNKKDTADDKAIRIGPLVSTSTLLLVDSMAHGEIWKIASSLLNWLIRIDIESRNALGFWVLVGVVAWWRLLKFERYFVRVVTHDVYW